MQNSPHSSSMEPVRLAGDPMPGVVRESRLVVPRPLHQRILERLLERQRGEHTLLLRVGRAMLTDGTELWLARELLPDRAALAAPAPGEHLFAVSLHDGSGPMPYVESQLDLYPVAVVGEIFYGEGITWRGKAWGFVRRHDGSHYAALDWLALPGAGMEEISLIGSAAPWPPALGAAEAERLSRTVGAFGPSSARTVAKLRAARYVLAGISRNGGFVFEYLARLGAEVSVFDPKPLQTAHLGEASLLFGPGDVGQGKASCAVRALARLQGQPSTGMDATPARVRAFGEPIDSPAGATEARAATVLVDCGDNDAVRLATAILATVFHKVQLSVACGVHFDGAGRRNLGADVRLIVPGSKCLRCCGGLADYAGALQELTSERRASTADPAATNWREERAGSLRSLNQIATGVGFRLLEDLFAGRITESRWVRVESDENGTLKLREPRLGVSAIDCPLCHKAGEGEAALT